MKIKKLYESESFDSSEIQKKIDLKISRLKGFEIAQSNIEHTSNEIYQYTCYVYSDIKSENNSERKETIKIPFRRIREKLENDLSFVVEFHIVFDANKKVKPKEGKETIRIKYIIDTSKEAGGFETDFEDDEPSKEIPIKKETEEKKIYDTIFGRINNNPFDNWARRPLYKNPYQEEQTKKKVYKTPEEICGLMEYYNDDSIDELNNILSDYYNDDISEEEMIESVMDLSNDYGFDALLQDILKNVLEDPDRREELYNYITENY